MFSTCGWYNVWYVLCREFTTIQMFHQCFTFLLRFLHITWHISLFFSASPHTYWGSQDETNQFLIFFFHYDILFFQPHCLTKRFYNFIFIRWKVNWFHFFHISSTVSAIVSFPSICCAACHFKNLSPLHLLRKPLAIPSPGHQLREDLLMSSRSFVKSSYTIRY